MDSVSLEEQCKTHPFLYISTENKLTVVASLAAVVQICCQGNNILFDTQCQNFIKNGNRKEVLKQTTHFFFYTIISAGPLYWQVSLLMRLPTQHMGSSRQGRTRWSAVELIKAAVHHLQKRGECLISRDDRVPAKCRAPCGGRDRGCSENP